MPHDTVSLIGERFGRLAVLSFSHIHPTRDMTVWNCVCDCGKDKKVARGELISKTAISCGCYRKDVPKEIKHGLIKHPLYRVWADIKTRCYNEKCQSYIHYGGRGIKMCDDWVDNFESFYDWSIENGWRKGLQIDRYPNNDGDYEPTNCRYATTRENMSNRRCTAYAEVDGIRKTSAEWAEITGGNKKVITNRIILGYTGYEAVFGRKRSNKYNKK